MCPCTIPAVTVGGKSVVSIENVGFDNDVTATTALGAFLLQVPNGAPGMSSVAVSASTGTGSLPVTYIPSADIIPASGVLSLLYDSGRSLLYVLKSTEIDVFNPATMVWQAPFNPAGNEATSYVAMTLTPDGSRLLVVGTNTNTLTIVNPDNPSQSVAASLPYQPIGVAATNTGKVFVPITTTSLDDAIEFDLASMTYTVRNDNVGSLSGKFVATPDGSHMAVAVVNGQSSTVNAWNSTTDSFISQTFPGTFRSDIAISPDGSKIAAITAPGLGITADILDEQLHWLSATVYPDLGQPDAEEGQGAYYTPSGETLVVPIQDSIEFFDANTGVLRDRLMTPELLPPLGAPTSYSVNMALDQTAQTIFAISALGLTVMKLPVPADQLAPAAWDLNLQ